MNIYDRHFPLIFKKNEYFPLSSLNHFIQAGSNMQTVILLQRVAGLQGVTLRNNFSLGLHVTFVKHQARSLAKLCQHEQLDKYSLVLIGLYSFVGAQIKRIYKLMACLQTLCLFKLKWCS